MDMRRATRGTALGIVAAATWAIAGLQLSSGPVELIPFTAPGALIGIGLGWLSHAFIRDTYTWRRGGGAALLGALLLPPWLVLLVGITGMTVADGAAVVVGGAWALLFVGLAVAAIRWALGRVDRERVRERMRRVSTLEWRIAPWHVPRGPSRLRAARSGDRAPSGHGDERTPER